MFKVLAISLGMTASVLAGPIEDLTGFYAASGNDCIMATGTLYLCENGNCISQDYAQGAQKTPTPYRGSASASATDTVDSNGFSVAAGDITMKFGDTLRIVRPNNDQLLTTYSARTNKGKVSFAFIKDGVAMDPSAKAQDLKLCPAYAEVTKQWLSEGGAPQRVEALAALPSTAQATLAESLIDVQFEPPVPNAEILEVVPLTLDDPEYPALMVLWVLNLGGTPLPLQILTYDRTTQTYVDNPNKVFAAGKAPLVDNPRSATTFESEHGTGIVVANSGMDRDPFPRAYNTLLMPNAQGKLVDYSKSLHQQLEFSHDVSSGVINERGDVGIYVNSMYVPFYYIMRDDRLIKANDRLPRAIDRDDKKFTSSALADLNGDGAADLILGSANEYLVNSVVYLNNGSGAFTGNAIELPATPFPERKMQFVDRMTGAGVQDIQAVKLDPTQDYWDLVVISTDGYSGHATQLLKNDGEGNFTDVTAQRIDAPESVYFNPSPRPYSWMYRAVIFETEDGVDIITKSEAPFETPSYVLGNTGDGAFAVVEEQLNSSITNAGTFGGQDMLIRITEDLEGIVLGEYPN